MKIWKGLAFVTTAALLTSCSSTNIRKPIQVDTPPPDGMANVYLFQRHADQLNRVMTFGLIAIADGYINVVVNDADGSHNVPKLGNKTAAVVSVKPGKVEVAFSFGGTPQVKSVQAEAGKNYFFTWNAPSGTNIGGLMPSLVSERNAKHQLMGRVLVE